MTKNRLEAFSDGVLAIAITIMVLEMKAPHEAAGFHNLRPVLPAFLAYVLSFVYVGIYWNNHHHMLHAAHKMADARARGAKAADIAHQADHPVEIGAGRRIDQLVAEGHWGAGRSVERFRIPTATSRPRSSGSPWPASRSDGWENRRWRR